MAIRDRMSAAGYTIIELKRSDTLVPASLLFVQGQVREVNRLPYMEVRSIVVRILQKFQPTAHIFRQ